MSVTQQQIDNFHEFASKRIGNGGSDLTWQELLDLWQLENPSSQEQESIYAALDESLADMNAGRHRPADEVMRELSRDMGKPLGTDLESTQNLGGIISTCAGDRLRQYGDSTTCLQNSPWPSLSSPFYHSG